MLFWYFGILLQKSEVKSVIDCMCEFFLFQNPLAALWGNVPASYHLQIVTVVVVISGALLIFSRLFSNETVLPAREVKNLKLALDVVEEVAERKVSLKIIMKLALFIISVSRC